LSTGGGDEAVIVAHSREWILRAWRLAALGFAAWLLHAAAQKNQNQPACVSLVQAVRYFPSAVRVENPGKDGAPDEVFDSGNRLLGFMATTAPQADSIIGYSGPNNVLVALAPSGRILGLELLASGDTGAHVKGVKGDSSFWKQFVGWTPSHEPEPRIEAVGGSTLTSFGIAEALQKRLAGRVDSLRFPEPLTLMEVKESFPQAAAFQTNTTRTGWFSVTDRSGILLGFCVRTSPLSDYTIGHSGPTESLIALAPDGETLLGVRLRRSYDTDDYVESVREDPAYLRQLTNFSVTQWAKIDLKKAGLEGVSGATETSFSIAEGVRRRFAADKAFQSSATIRLKLKDWALFGIIGGSLVMTFTSLKGKRAARLIWQAILIGVFGLWLGDLLSVALLTGWAQNGLAWQFAPALVLLGAVALLVPWATRRQLYCYQLCPHGAAQEWLGRFPKLHVQLSDRATKCLRFLPGVLLVFAFFIGLMSPRFELAALEPFDAWTMRGAALASAVIAVGGLVASLFVPMAYCRFGCPTGALLKFVRTSGSNERFGLRDIIAACLLAGGALLSFGAAREAVAAAKPVLELHGSCFGTTWDLKLRNKPKDISALEKKLSTELERIESTLSHWRSNSATSQFNAARTTQPIEMPEELVRIVARCLRLSRLSNGAFDVTVAPLVQAWGFGPSGTHPNEPEPIELARLRNFVGWEKLTADTNTFTLQKSHPELQLDLGAILQGYAADCLATILRKEGRTEYLINVGGELLAAGSWRVAIENPADPKQPLRIVQLRGAALATSGTYRAKHSDGKKHWSHLIDPATGRPVEHSTTLISVVTTSCADADAWATTLLVVGMDRAELLAKTNGLSVLSVSGGKLSEYRFPPNEEVAP
jgi:NosR/NirI family nitrous oxide reductase transcriptional regulator